MDREHIEVRRHRLPGLDICDVTMDELDSLERLGSNVGLDFNVALFSLGIFLSFLTSLLSTKIGSDRVFETFVIFTVLGAALAIVFGIKWFLGRGEFSRLVQKIRDRQIGPVGAEGKELNPSDLAHLPARKAGESTGACEPESDADTE